MDKQSMLDTSQSLTQIFLCYEKISKNLKMVDVKTTHIGENNTLQIWNALPAAQCYVIYISIFVHCKIGL